MRLATLFLITLFILSCSPTAPLSEPTLTIETDSTNYFARKLIQIGVTITNNLGRQVLIPLSCGLTFELDRSTSDGWILVLSPICGNFPIGPDTLSSGWGYYGLAEAYVDDPQVEIPAGLYRLRVKITEVDGVPINSQDWQFSNSFVFTH